MAQKIQIDEFLKLAETLAVIDVRSPGEFEQGHIPGAQSLPLFTNDERALVGTRYKQAGRDFAIQLGLELVGPKLADFTHQARRLAKGNKLLVHCWRGGMRSSSMAWLFELIGLKVWVLEGGYKAYRAHIREQFNVEISIRIVGGYTGSGKTEILKEIKNQGAQFIDLEGIAHHKGSAFGTIGQLPQPTNEQFENNLALEWSKLNKNEAVWLEDESVTMGQCGIPFPLFKRMREAIVYKVIVPKKIREQRLVNEYVTEDVSELSKALERISKKLGGLRYQQAVEALEMKQFDLVADISLQYYDKAYEFGISKREPRTIIDVPVENDNPTETAKLILELDASRQV